MARVTIKCTEHEMIEIKNILEGNCFFQIGTIKNCGEDSDCHECMDSNVEFIIEDGEE